MNCKRFGRKIHILNCWEWLMTTTVNCNEAASVQPISEPLTAEIHFSSITQYACLFGKFRHTINPPQWPSGLRWGSVAARLLGVAGSNPARWNGCLSLVTTVCRKVEVSATGSLLVQRSPTDCVVSWVWSRYLNKDNGLEHWDYRAIRIKLQKRIFRIVTRLFVN